MFLLSINVNNSEYTSMILPTVGILLQSFSVSHCQGKPRSSTIPSINSIFKIFIVSNSTYRSLEYSGRPFSSTLENTTLGIYPTNSIFFLKTLNLYRGRPDLSSAGCLAWLNPYRQPRRKSVLWVREIVEALMPFQSKSTNGSCSNIIEVSIFGLSELVV